MVTKLTDEFLIIRIERGDSYINCIKDACKKYSVKCATISGIGAVDTFVCGIFNPETKHYKELTYNGMYEILSLCGNITQKDNECYVHAHICVSDSEGKAFGGHLIEANCSVTGEIFISLINADINRRFDDNIGINLMEL